MTQTAAERRFVRLAGSMNTKASRLGRTGTITANHLAMAFLMSEWRCTYCGIGIDPMHCSFDHVIPFDRGGLNTPENVVACCLSCQRRKSRKLPSQYAEVMALGQVACDGCGRMYTPRWADWVRGYGRMCSRSCSGKKGGETRNPASSAPGRAK